MNDFRSSDHELLVQAIYDAADDPNGFGDVLAQIGATVAAHAGHLLVIPAGATLAENHSFGADETSAAEYDRVWRGQDPRFAEAVKRPNRVLSDVAVVDAAAFERSALYNEHLAKVDVRYTVFTTCVTSPELVAGVALMRSKRAGAFDVEEVARLAAVAPHVARAARLRHVVQSLRDEIEDLRRALDCAIGAVAVLDRAGRVLCANAAAEALLAQRDGLYTELGVLRAVVPDETRALEAVIAKAALLADARRPGVVPAHLAPFVRISRSDGVPVGATFLPLRARNIVRARARGARVLAVFHDPKRILRIDRALAAKLHGLTPTEAELAAALAEGRTLAEFAEARGCSEQTGRTHLKRILEKTGTSRQADLVRVLLTGAAMHQVR